MIPNVYEIHKYEHDRFQCVVARTNKYDEEKIREDTERMNSMLCQEAKSQGIRYLRYSINVGYDKTTHKEESERTRRRTNNRLQ